MEKNDFDGLEDIFHGIESTIKNEININEDLLNDYKADRELFERDVVSGLIDSELETLFRKKLKEYENESLKKKNVVTKEKTKMIQIIRKPLPKNLGFIEPILLSLIIGGLGTIYLSYLYLAI